MKKPFMIIIGFVLFTASLAGTGPAYAQNGDFTIYPTYAHGDNYQWIIQKSQPGKTIHESVTLENLSDMPQTLVLSIEEAEMENNEFKPKGQHFHENLGFWLKIPETQYFLNPHEKIKIPVEINIDAKAATKKYAGVIYASSEQMGTANIKIVSRIGVRIYLNVMNSGDLQTNIFNSPEFQNYFFFIFSFIGILTAGFYNFIHVRAKRLSEK